MGTIALLDIGFAMGALRKMFVAKNYRGPEYGVSKGLLKTLMNWASEKRVEEIYLGTTDRFLAAHRFYEKNGFKQVCKHELPKSFPVMVVDTVFYKHNIKNKK